MREAASYYGESSRAHAAVPNGRADRATMIDKTTGVSSKKHRGLVVKRSLLAFVAIAILVVGTISLLTVNQGELNWPAHTAAQNVIKGFTLLYQHSDNPGGFICMWCGMWMPWHLGVPVLWDDVKYGGVVPGAPPGDNIYGPIAAMDDCPHCIVYSGPACIQMVAFYRSGVMTPQDVIYDMSELDKANGELQNNGACERHGFGVLDGTGGSPPEIQTAFMAYIGPVFQHNQWDASMLTPQTLESYILGLYPVIWDDHNGWPSNMDPRWPSPPDTQLQGHYKVIAGYDDGGTVGDPRDDFALIFDPWPGYNDLIAQNPTPLPPGAIPGGFPGPYGPSPDPYWLPVAAVLGDVGDLFLVEFAAIPEFSGLLIPIVGTTVIALVAIRFGTGRREP